MSLKECIFCGKSKGKQIGMMSEVFNEEYCSFECFNKHVFELLGLNF